MILESIPVIFYKSDLKLDIFLLRDYHRYFCNILHDISFYFALTALFYILWKRVSRIYRAFFIWRLLEILGYFLVASQKTNLFTLPILLIILIYEKRKQA